LSPSRNSIASREPVEAPDGTAARPTWPDVSVTSASSVGLPRLSRISRAWTLLIVVMMASLPVAWALAVTCFISQGERNWPFLIFTGLPALATFWMKSVWRHRKAGVCSTSTTLVTSSSGVYSCTSVSTGRPNCRFTSLKTFKPASRPGPRKLVPEVRLALSKLDLKMKGMPSAEVISLSLPAVSICSSSDSITQGPAMRKNG
jgi:hypothetical protein